MIDEKLLDNHLVQSDDVRKCPKPECRFAGTLPERENGFLLCSENLECAKCGHGWKDPLQRSSLPWRLELSARLSTFVTNLRKIFQTEPCPSCGVPIQKISGCAKVNCIKCKYEFCWDCLGKYKNYTHEPGMDVYCGLRVASVGLTIGGLITLLIIKAIENYKALRPPVEQPVTVLTPILTRLENGESLFTKQNVLETIGAWVVIHIYLAASIVIMIATEEITRFTSFTVPMIVSEFIALLVLVATCPGMRDYPMQLLYFELLLIVGIFAAVGAGFIFVTVAPVTFTIKFVLFGLGAFTFMAPAVETPTDNLHDSSLLGLLRAVLPMVNF